MAKKKRSAITQTDVEIRALRGRVDALERICFGLTLALVEMQPEIAEMIVKDPEMRFFSGGIRPELKDTQLRAMRKTLDSIKKPVESSLKAREEIMNKLHEAPENS